MKKYIAALACALALLVPCSGCATLASVGGAEESSAAETAQPTEAPTAAPTPTAEPTPTASPTAEPTPDPAAALQGCTWVAYAETSGVEHFIFKLNFNEDGTMSYMAGWYMSEVAYQGTGTYTADGERITYTLSSDSADERLHRLHPVGRTAHAFFFGGRRAHLPARIRLADLCR